MAIDAVRQLHPIVRSIGLFMIKIHFVWFLERSGDAHKRIPAVVVSELLGA
jgi:hypothetical protein